MTDLIHLMGSLVGPDGTISIPGINDQVAPLHEKERALYDELAFSMTELHGAIGSQTALFPDEKNTLMHRFYRHLMDGVTVDGDILLFLSMGSKVPFQRPGQKPSFQLVSSESSPFEPFPIWSQKTFQSL